MAGLTLLETLAAAVPTPAANKGTLFFETADGLPYYKDDAGATHTLVGATGATGAAGAATIITKDEGSTVDATATTLNFVGAGVTATDAGGGVTTITIAGGGGGSSDPSVNGFRLTLTTGVPITTSDVTGATTIYCCPYKGNQIALYDGAAWNVRSSAQFSLALGTLTAALPYDVFCYDNATVPTLEFLAWTNATTRATALVYQDGILVKSGTTTRRYLGTFYTTSTTQTEDSGGGATTQVGGKRFLWNYYNRISRSLAWFDSAFYTYATDTWRQQNAATGNKVEFVRGLNEDPVWLEHKEALSNASNSTRGSMVSVGVDSTTTPITNVGGGYISTGSAFEINMSAVYNGFPGIGYHFLAGLEKGGDGTSRFGVDVIGLPVSTGYVMA